MEIKSRKIDSYGIRLSVVEDEKEIARAYLYIMRNDLHDEPFGLMEDVFVEVTGIEAGAMKQEKEKARKGGGK